MSEDRKPQEDNSTSRSLVLYGLFIGAGVLIMTATLVVPLLTIATTLGACKRDSVCMSLEKDLRYFRDPNVHPCDDFYEHVCGRWDGIVNRKYIVPYVKYEVPFNAQRIRSLFRLRIPLKPQRSEIKASWLLLHCLSQPLETKSADLLTSHLRRLRLPWPHKSPTSRQQLLDIMVQASLQLGLPAVWAFHVGRHPEISSENTLYLDLAERTGVFIGTLHRLVAKGTADNFLRLCAEVIGGTGQSYSSMIDDVLAIHEKFSELISNFSNALGFPAYMDLSDPQLRRAVNGHLPDNSQLWHNDKIVNMQPMLFESFDEQFLQTPQGGERFKLFLGSYVVWDLSPLTSRYLTSHLMEALDNPEFTSDYITERCLAAVVLVIPMVSWKSEDSLIRDKLPAFRALEVSKQSFAKYALKYSQEAKSLIGDETDMILMNSLNSTLTSKLLDVAYNFLTVTWSGHFFNTFVEATSVSVAFFKASLRRPRHGIVYILGLSQVEVYRMLVAREATVPSFLQAPPLVLPDSPLQVLAAVIGMRVNHAVLMLIDLLFFHDKQFRALEPAELAASPLRPWLEDFLKMKRNISSRATYLLDSEHRQVALRSLSAALSFGSYKDLVTNGTDSSKTERKLSFDGVPPEQLFFLVKCFTTCGEGGRFRMQSIALCNAALPAVNGFKEAFKCSPSQPLAFNFTWVVK